ncbi:MAG: hypothetical protein O7A66_00365 [Alphaproteobacteria bacterium]|nr:hypothetical protein [Alphaproteobacteria bacterium]
MLRTFSLYAITLAALLVVPVNAKATGGSDQFLLTLANESDSRTCYVGGKRLKAGECVIKETEQAMIDLMRTDDEESDDDDAE